MVPFVPFLCSVYYTDPNVSSSEQTMGQRVMGQIGRQM